MKTLQHDLKSVDFIVTHQMKNIECAAQFYTCRSSKTLMLTIVLELALNFCLAYVCGGLMVDIVWYFLCV